MNGGVEPVDCEGGRGLDWNIEHVAVRKAFFDTQDAPHSRRGGGRSTRGKKEATAGYTCVSCAKILYKKVSVF